MKKPSQKDIEERERKEKKIDLFCTIFLCFVLLLSIDASAYQYLLLPSYKSVQADCTFASTGQVKDPKGGFISGYFNQSDKSIYVRNGNGFIKIGKSKPLQVLSSKNPPPREVIEFVKHELCHARQFEEGRMSTCNNKIGLFFNELECYIKQYQ